jgi:ATP-dependent RNA helicase DeaD
MTFMTLPSDLHPALARALTARGYETLTQVQQEMTVAERATKDMLVSAQTGSGKTVGFGVAMAPTLLEDGDELPPAGAPLALIIAPTRELALQVRREFEWLYRECNARMGSCVGGMDMRTERRTLERGTHIVVGTPGRLRDHIERGSIDLSQIRAVVLDEADEMLDMGFAEDLELILSSAPEDRRTLMFSATVPKGIERLAKNFLKDDAERVRTISNTPQHADITYKGFSVMPHHVDAAVINTLRLHEAENAIVFCNTRVMVARLTARLSNRGFQVVALSGELTQQERTNALQAMRDGRARVCVATDVAARGIDLPKLDLVVHAELPSNSETLLHRSGRTGRAGRKGVSVLIAPPKVRKKAERLLGWAKLSAEWGDAPSAEAVRAADRDRMLTDPVWYVAEEARHEDVALLTDKFSAEQLAQAYLALHEERHSAPEELENATMGKDRKREPRVELGPSGWVSLSVGRKERAEARWLLPMLLRSGDLTKDEIGAIRVARDLTYVELGEKARARFLDKIGDGGEMEKGVRVAAVDELPDLPKPEPRKRFDDDRKPHRKGPRRDDDRGDRGGDRGGERRERKPREDRDGWGKGKNPKQMAKDWEDRRDDEGKRDKPKYDKPKFDKPKSDKPRFEKPKRDPEVHDHAKKPFRKADGDGDRKPRHKKGGYEGKPDHKGERKFDGKPGGKGPKGDFKGKRDFRDGPREERKGDFKGKGKPGGKSFGKPGGKFEGKPSGKPGGKPAGKFGGKPKSSGPSRGPDAMPRRKK